MSNDVLLYKRTLPTDSSQSCPVWNFDNGCFLLLFFSAWFRHFELSLKQTLVSLEVGCFSIIFDHSSTDWSSTDPVILQFLPDALDALRSSGPHWCLAGHAPRRAPSGCGATRASWPSQDHRNVGTNHWQWFQESSFTAFWMLSERNECPALFLDLGEAFRGVFSRLKLKLGDAKVPFRDSFQTIFHLRAWRTGCKKDKNGSLKRFHPARGPQIRVLQIFCSCEMWFFGVQGRHLLHLG